MAWPPFITNAAGGGGFAAGVSTDANGTTGTVASQVVFFEGNTNVTLSQSINGASASISIFAPSPGGGGGASDFWFEPEIKGASVGTSHTNGTLYLRPFENGAYEDLDKYIFQQNIATVSASTMSMSASVSAGNASSGSGTWGQTGTVLMFSRVDTNEANASYNSIKTFQSNTYSMGCGYSASVSWSTNASSATASFTTSYGVSFIKNIDGNGGFTTTATGTSGSTTFSSTSTNANSFSSSYVMSAPFAHMSSMRPIFVPAAGTALPPSEYWIGIIQSTNSGSTNMGLHRVAQMSNISMQYYTASGNAYAEIGNSVTMNTSNFRLGFGSYSASSNTTGNIALTQVSMLPSNASMYFALDGKTL